MNWQIYAHPTQRHLVANNGNFRLLLLQVIQADQLADLPPPVEASSGQEWQFQIAIVTGHIGRLTDRSIPLQQRHLGAKNGNFRLLLLQVTQADQLADLPPPQVEASSGQEWQFLIAIVTGHIGRLTGRSPHQQRYLVAKNGNFRFLLLQVIQADQLADVPPSRGIWWPSMTISDCYCQRSHRQIN